MNRSQYEKTLLEIVTYMRNFGTLFLCLPLLAEDRYELEEIIVTAQKKEQAVQDMSVSVNAFTNDNIKNLRLLQPIDLSTYAPGVSIKPTVGNQNPVITIRGIGFNDFTSIQNPSTAVYMNQVLLPYHPMMSFQLFDLDRIEVLKGPQGTLYGRNATGGAINFIPNKPTLEREISGGLGFSSYETYEFEGAVSGPLTDVLAARVSIAGIDQRGGYQKNRVNNDDAYGGIDRIAGRLLLSLISLPDADVLLDVHGGKDDSDPVALEHLGSFTSGTFEEPCAQVAAGNRAEGPCTSASGYFDNDGDPYSGDYSVTRGGTDNASWGTSLTINKDFPRLTLTSITGYENFSRNQLQDIDASPIAGIDVTFDDDTWAWSQEVRIASDESWPMNWIAGVFFSRDSVSALQQADSRESFLSTVVDIKNEQEDQSASVFTHIEWPLSNNWALVGGLRYTYEKKEWEGGSTDLNPNGTSALAGLTTFRKDEISDSELTGRIGLEFRPTDDWLLYVNHNKGFRSGGFPGAFTTTNTQLEPFESEKVFATEGGFKASLWDHTMQLNMAGYHYDWQDLQTQISVTRSGLISLSLDNAGDAEIMGVETELIWRPLQHLEIQAGINWMDHEIKDSDDPRLEGAELPNAPELTFNGQIQYHMPMGKYHLTMQGNITYTDDRFFTSDNVSVFVGDSYWLFHSRITLRKQDSPWGFAFWGRNLTDKEYRTEGANQFGAVGSSYFAYGEPRTVGVHLSFDL